MTEKIIIEVVPSSKDDRIIPSEHLLVCVKAPASRGEANKSAARLLSRYFGKRVRIISNSRRRKKIIEVG